ncbi:MAG TPA: glycosyltransferase, partial [Candidatus Paceibacterota bacterium]
DVVQMASDQFVTVNKFSKPSLNYGNLPDAIRYYFGIDVDPDWRLWNSGVFLFDARSKDFLDTWHQFTVKTFDLPQWKVKDQGPLVAAVWRHGLQRADRIPSTYNWLFGMSERGKAKTLFTGKGFKFRKSKIDILHFIGGTRNMGKKEWLDAFRIIMSEKSDEFRGVRKYQASVIRADKGKARRLKTAVGLFVLGRLWAVSMVLRNNVPGYSERLDAFKDKLNERSLRKSSQGPIDGRQMGGTL